MTPIQHKLPDNCFVTHLALRKLFWTISFLVHPHVLVQDYNFTFRALDIAIRACISNVLLYHLYGWEPCTATKRAGLGGCASDLMVLQQQSRKRLTTCWTLHL